MALVAKLQRYSRRQYAVALLLFCLFLAVRAPMPSCVTS
jgi:hypothetical protein